MIEVIGLKRLVILISLVLLNLALAALTYLYIVPESFDAEKKLTRVERGVRTARSELSRMQVEFEILEKQQDRFDSLKEAGYFSTQARSDAKKLLSDIRRRSGVVSAVASVDRGVTSDSFGVSKVKYKILTSMITVNLQAFDDADIYKYVDLLQRHFPGDVTVDSLSLSKAREVNAVVLRAIASGASPALVNASLTASWSTLIPEDQVITE